MTTDLTEESGSRFGGIEVLRWLTLSLIMIFHTNDYLRHEVITEVNNSIQFLRIEIFFGIAGFLVISQTRNKEFRRFVTTKSTRLIYPFYTFGIFYFFANQFFTTSSSLKEITIYFFHYLYSGESHLWFLQSMFLIYIFGFIIVRLFDNLSNVYSFIFHIVLIVSIQLLIYLAGDSLFNEASLLNWKLAIFYSPYFFVGSASRVFADSIQKFCVSQYRLIYLLLLLGSIAINFTSNKIIFFARGDLGLFATLILATSIRVNWILKFSHLVMPVYLTNPLFVFLICHSIFAGIESSSKLSVITIIVAVFLTLILNVAFTEVYRLYAPVWTHGFLGLRIH